MEIGQTLSNLGIPALNAMQEAALPAIQNHPKVVLLAPTGSGKTLAFLLPVLSQLKADKPGVQCLILSPTRELAIQMDESIKAYGRNLPLRSLVIFGGVSDKAQIDSLRRRTDILVATPGRLLDLMQQGYVKLNHIKFFVLDEADRMLDMGFIHDVRKVIAKLPTRRHTLFFSATMPPEIVKLSDSILTNPAQVEITPVSSTAEKVEQAVFFVDKNDKKHLLVHLLKNPEITSALIFTRTKHGADRVVRDLIKTGTPAKAIHGNKSQNARQNALSNFKSGKIRVLVATDIAARGIDVDNLSHVINFEIPNIPESDIHRIGRTGRVGASGIALTFCDQEEKAFLKDIQKLIRQNVPVVNEHPWPLSGAGIAAFDQPEPSRQPQQRRETSTAAYGGGNRRKNRTWRGNSNSELNCVFTPPGASVVCAGRSRGLVLLTPHYESFCLGIAFLGRTGGVVNSMSSSVTQDPRVDPAVRRHFDNKYRGLETYLNGGRVIDMESGLRPFYRMLEQHETLVVLADAPVLPGGAAMSVNFLGGRRTLAAGAVRLAQRTGSDLGGFICAPTATGRYELTLCQPGPSNDPATIDRVYGFMSAAIMANPGGWWAGFRRSAWIVVAGLGLHGVFDLFHHALITNPGVPVWWPGW